MIDSEKIFSLLGKEASDPHLRSVVAAGNLWSLKAFAQFLDSADAISPRMHALLEDMAQKANRDARVSLEATGVPEKMAWQINPRTFELTSVSDLEAEKEEEESE